MLVTPPQVAAGYSTLTLDGTNLTAATSVTVGATPQVISTNTATQIVTGPLSASTPLGMQSVEVTTAAGTSNSTNVSVLDRLRITAASSRGPTTIELTLNRPADPATVAAARFTIPGLGVTAALASGPTITLTTDPQPGGGSYSVTADNLLLDLIGTPVTQDPFTFTGYLPTEFVVMHVGDGTAALSTTSVPVFLERRAIATGSIVTALAMPITDAGTNLAFTMAGSASGDGSLSLSPDGKALACLGYQSPPGTASVQTTTAPRVVAVVDALDFGAPAGIDTSTTIGTTYSGTAPRGAVIDGARVWLTGGSGGVFTTTLGATANATNVSTTVGNNRSIAIFAGQLYSSTGAGTTGFYAVGTGQPITSGNTQTLLVTSASPYSFALFDLNAAEPGVDTLYLADDGTNQGIKRFRKSGGAWAASPEAILGPAVRHIACFRDGSDVVCVGSASGALYRFRDANSATASSQTVGVSIGTAPTNTGFRGVALMPLP